MGSSPDALVGKVLRLHAMADVAAQTEASESSAQALVEAHNDLLSQVRNLFRGDPRGVEVGGWLPLRYPPAYNANAPETLIALAAAADQAKLRLQMLVAWLGGVVDEEVLPLKLRAEAEARAALDRTEPKPPIGFGS